MKVLCGVSDIFPWQTIWDLSKKFQLRRNICSHKKIGNPQNMQFIPIFIWFICKMSRYSMFWVYVSDEGALRGLRYFSLTKNLRLVKKFQLRRNICSHKTIGQSTKVTLNAHLLPISVGFWARYQVILSFEFWGRMKVLCGVPDIFPWQRIWDWSKKIAAPQKYLLSQENRKIHKSHQKHAFYSRFCVIWYTISRYSEFWVLGSDEGALRGPRYFSLTKHLRLVKNISAQQKYLLPQWNRKIHESDSKCRIIHDFGYFMYDTTLFWVLGFCVWRRCSAGSQIFFLDK